MAKINKFNRPTVRHLGRVGSLVDSLLWAKQSYYVIRQDLRSIMVSGMKASDPDYQQMSESLSDSFTRSEECRRNALRLIQCAKHCYEI